MNEVREGVEALLAALAAAVLEDLPPLRRKAYEHLVTELVHQRDVTRRLIAARIASARAFEWLSELRVYYDAKSAAAAAQTLGSPAEQAASTDDAASRQLLDALQLRQANATFAYGWEYLGVGERLVQTPLTDRCVRRPADRFVVIRFLSHTVLFYQSIVFDIDSSNACSNGWIALWTSR
jgi:dynein heavy chain 1